METKIKKKRGRKTKIKTDEDDDNENNLADENNLTETNKDGVNNNSVDDEYDIDISNGILNIDEPNEDNENSVKNKRRGRKPKDKFKTDINICDNSQYNIKDDNVIIKLPTSCLLLNDEFNMDICFYTK